MANLNIDLVDNTNILNSNHSTIYSRLPKTLPIKKLGYEYKKVIGYIDINSLERLKDLIIEQNDKILVELQFSISENNHTLISSTITHKVKVICQRCLDVMSYDVNSNIAICLLDKNLDNNDIDEITKKYKNFDVIKLSELLSSNDEYNNSNRANDRKKEFKNNNSNLIDIYQMIEDEIILSMPSAIKHNGIDQQNCISLV